MHAVQPVLVLCIGTGFGGVDSLAFSGRMVNGRVGLGPAERVGATNSGPDRRFLPWICAVCPLQDIPCAATQSLCH